MKKYIVISLFLAALLISACNKLDIKPQDEISDKEMAYKNPSITNQILAGIYSLLLHENTWGSLINMRFEAATDVAITRMTIVETPENNTHTSQSAMLDATWSTLYKGINAANEFVYYSERFTPASTTRTQMVAEARFLRAYFYFTLVRLFGDVPFYTEPTKDLSNTDIARTSAVDIYDFIVKELIIAQRDLRQPNEVVYGHIAKTAAQTALADVYLNMGGLLMKNRLPADSTVQLMNQRAAYWCEQVLANPAHDITKTDYITVFMNQVRNVSNVSEQVWELQPKYLVDQGFRCDTRLGKYNGMGASVVNVYGASANLYHGVELRKYYTKISGDDAVKDVRMDWNCPLTKIADGSKLGEPVYKPVNDKNENPYQLFEGKWRTIFANTLSESTNINYSGARLSMYRIADVHLMYAEALNEGYNNQTDALDQINIIRNRAKATPITVVPSKSDMFNLIVDERARELCFEGKRRFDLIRWGIYGQKVTEAESGYANPTNANSVTQAMLVGFKNFDATRHYIFPIPQNEISRNALINPSDQNMGWGGNHAWK